MIKAVIVCVAGITLLAAGLMVLLCIASKDPYVQALEDAEQIKWLKEWNGRKKRRL